MLAAKKSGFLKPDFFKPKKSLIFDFVKIPFFKKSALGKRVYDAQPKGCRRNLFSVVAMPDTRLCACTA